MRFFYGTDSELGRSKLFTRHMPSTESTRRPSPSRTKLEGHGDSFVVGEEPNLKGLR